MLQTKLAWLGLGIGITLACVSECRADGFLVADGSAWPGRILTVAPSASNLHWQRPNPTSDRTVPRVQSLTTLSDGRLVFCSGLDRSVMALGPSGEFELHHGGGLVRQVRTDSNGDLYWSGLETPRDGNPLPDGFIYRKIRGTGETQTVCTFSQSDTHHDWWGAFDVRQGHLFVMTHRQPSKIYVLENSIPVLRWTLPIAATAFRLESDRSLLASDGNGKLYRFPDLSNTSSFDVLLDQPARFVDFVAER
jgi:hypothetical protein